MSENGSMNASVGRAHQAGGSGGGDAGKRVAGLRQDVDKITKSLKEWNDLATSFSKKIETARRTMDTMGKTKPGGAQAGGIAGSAGGAGDLQGVASGAAKATKAIKAARDAVADLSTALAAAEMKGRIFGKSFKTGMAQVGAFQTQLKRMINQVAALSGGPEGDAANALLQKFRTQQKAINEMSASQQKLAVAFSETKDPSQKSALAAEMDRQRDSARGLATELRTLHVEVMRMRSESMQFSSRSASDVFSRKEEARMLWRDRALRIEKKSVASNPALAQSMGGQLRLVNIELARYENLKKRGFATDTQRAQSLGFTAEKVRQLRDEQARLNKEVERASGVGAKQKTTVPAGTGGGDGKQGGMFAGGAMGWGNSVANQMRYWGQLRILYGLYAKVNKGMKMFTDLTGTTNRAVRTSVTDVTDLNAVWRAQNEIADAATNYLSRHLGTVAEYTEAVHQLTQAEMARSEALRIAPTIMALSKGLDAGIKETSRVMVGLNELFKDLDGMSSDSGRINKMASMLSLAVKKEVTTIEDLRTSLAYVAPVAKNANMSFAELIASVSLLHTNMMQSSRAGTAMRQMLNALAKNADKLNAAFNLGIEADKPMQFADIMGALGERLKEGQMTSGKLKEFLSGFGLRGAPGAIIIPEQFEGFSKLVGELEKAKMTDLFGMRDIMEKNVPGQLKIMSQNVDLLIGSIMRGAFGGREFAESLENVNRKMSATMPYAVAIGKALKNLAGGWKMLAWVAAFSIQGMLKKIAALRTAQAGLSFGKALTSVASGNVVGLALNAAALATFGIMAARESARARKEEEYRQTMESLAATRTEIEEIENKITSLKKLQNVEMTSLEQKKLLSDANRDLIQTSAQVGVSYDREVESIDGLVKKYEELKVIRVEAERIQSRKAVKSVYDKYTSLSEDPYRKFEMKYLRGGGLEKAFTAGESELSALMEEFPRFVKNAQMIMPKDEALKMAKKMLDDTNLARLFENYAEYYKGEKITYPEEGYAHKDDQKVADAMVRLNQYNSILDNYNLSVQAAAAQVQQMVKSFQRLVVQAKMVRAEYNELVKLSYDDKMAILKSSGLKPRDYNSARLNLVGEQYQDRTSELGGLLNELNASDDRITAIQKQYNEMAAAATATEGKLSDEQIKNMRQLESDLKAVNDQKEEMLNKAVDITKELRAMRIEMAGFVSETKKAASAKNAWGLVGSGTNEFFAGKKYTDASGRKHTMNRRQYVASLAKESYKKIVAGKMAKDIRATNYAGSPGSLESTVMSAAGKDTAKSSRWLEALRFGVNPYYDNQQKLAEKQYGINSDPYMAVLKEKADLKKIVAGNKAFGGFNNNKFMDGGFTGMMSDKYGKDVELAMPMVFDQLTEKLDPFAQAVEKFATASDTFAKASTLMQLIAQAESRYGLGPSIMPGTAPAQARAEASAAAVDKLSQKIVIQVDGEDMKEFIYNVNDLNSNTVRVLEKAARLGSATSKKLNKLVIGAEQYVS